jgi:hypothetical protein
MNYFKEKAKRILLPLIIADLIVLTIIVFTSDAADRHVVGLLLHYVVLDTICFLLYYLTSLIYKSSKSYDFYLILPLIPISILSDYIYHVQLGFYSVDHMDILIVPYFIFLVVHFILTLSNKLAKSED